MKLDFNHLKERLKEAISHPDRGKKKKPDDPLGNHIRDAGDLPVDELNLEIEQRRKKSDARRAKLVRQQRQLVTIGAAGVVLILILGLGIRAGHRNDLAAKKTAAELSSVQKTSSAQNKADSIREASSDVSSVTQGLGKYIWASPKGATDGNSYPTTVSASDPSNKENNGKIIYLTFDDGPSKYTSTLLDTLDKYPQVRVTFFVVGQWPDHFDMIKRAAKAGHSIGVHSYTHNFYMIYKSSNAFWSDFEKMQDVIQKETGYRTQLMRFAGGSSNTISRHICSGIMTELSQESASRGYTYFDWNTGGIDAGKPISSTYELNYLKAHLYKQTPNLILCHDSKSYTVEAMKKFIPWALKQGYTFLPLSPHSFTGHQKIEN